MKRAASVLCTLWLTLSCVAFAGGPLAVGGPSLGVEGQPMTWPGGSVNYRVDGGAFVSGNVSMSNAMGVTRVQQMFSVWTSVPTTSLTVTNQGSILPIAGFTDGDVNAPGELAAVLDDCNNGHQSPIVFDANGSMFAELVGDPGVVGIGSPCANDSSGHILTGFAMLNGSFLDGIANSSNFETTNNVFDEAITHELGHLLGLDHSQVNVELINAAGNCDLTAQAGLPLMFPFLVCKARVDVGLPKLAPDDIAWISHLYPNGNFNSQYGIISGRILFTDGITGTQGVNVIAREVNSPKKIAVSVVSGYLFTGNVGQDLSGDNTGGDNFGSRQPATEGYFEIPVPAGTYTLEVEPVSAEFSAGSRVGPLADPIPNPGFNEFWDDVESSADDPEHSTPIAVGAGATVNNKDIILDGTAPRFDDYEDE